MLNFNSTGIGSITPFGIYAGYLLYDSGNLWIGGLFLAISVACFLLSASYLLRFIINYRRLRLTQASDTGRATSIF